MSKVYLHSKNNNEVIIKIILLLLIPFALYGFYKNGILLYHRNYIRMIEVFKPLLYIIIALGTSLLFKIIYKEETYSYRLLLNVFISLIVSFNTSLLFYVPCILIFNIIYKYYRFNMASAFMLLSLLYLLIFKDYSFFNPIESSVAHNYAFADFLIGKSSGGVSNTLIVMSLISLIILCININYKKHIPIVGLVTFYSLITMTCLITSKVDINLFLNSNLLFAFVFLAPLSVFTPYTKGGAYMFGLLMGAFSFALSFIDINLAVYLSIFILSFIAPFLDNFVTKKGKKIGHNEKI